MNLIKKIVRKESYILYVIKKAKNTLYKSYIRFNRELNDLIYSNIYKLIIFRELDGSKYFIIFLHNFNKRFKIKIIKYKSEAFVAFRRF